MASFREECVTAKVCSTEKETCVCESDAIIEKVKLAHRIDLLAHKHCVCAYGFVGNLASAYKNSMQCSSK